VDDPLGDLLDMYSVLQNRLFWPVIETAAGSIRSVKANA
jgi:hypothetical protein